MTDPLTLGLGVTGGRNLAGRERRRNDATRAGAANREAVRTASAGRYGDLDAIPSIWPEFSEILSQARVPGEFDATRLLNLIEAVGKPAGNDPAYNVLIEEVAAFLNERTGEAEGALVLLKRAQKFDFDNHFEMTRLLGKAARRLTKKEYAEKLINALQQLSLAYRSAGLHWATLATCIFAAASIAIDGEADSQIDLAIVPTIELIAWVALELRYRPDFSKPSNS